MNHYRNFQNVPFDPTRSPNKKEHLSIDPNSPSKLFSNLRKKDSKTEGVNSVHSFNNEIEQNNESDLDNYTEENDNEWHSDFHSNIHANNGFNESTQNEQLEEIDSKKTLMNLNLHNSLPGAILESNILQNSENLEL